MHLYRVRIADHVVVGEDVAIGRDDEPGPERLTVTVRKVLHPFAEEMFEQVTEGASLRDVWHRKALWQRPLNLRFLLCTDIDHGRAVALGQLGELGKVPRLYSTGHARNQHTA